jgi:protoheme IX farnesyltransferase
MGVFPALFGITWWISSVIAVGCGLVFFWQAVKHVRTRSRKTALAIMYTSFLYLPIVQIAFLMDKL